VRPLAELAQHAILHGTIAPYRVEIDLALVAFKVELDGRGERVS
jgi:hypothetical protein